MTQPIIYKNNILKILDQRLLPVEEKYIECKTVDDVVESIRLMKIRGAPAIGVAAAFGYFLGIRSGENKDSVYEKLIRSRPTAVNLKWAVDLMEKSFTESGYGALEEKALEVLENDISKNKRIGEHGNAVLENGDNVLTHCNAGSLATAGFGTALGVIRQAVSAGKEIHVYVDETRPFLQGSRLTSFELKRDNIDHTLICDNMAGFFMRNKKVDKVIVGADRIALNGDTANKIGTYQLAILCDYHNIPFYIAAPISTIDFTVNSGAEIPIEYRGGEEITYISGIKVAPENIKTSNPAFDITPSELIFAFITEEGIFKNYEIKTIIGGVYGDQL